MLTQTQNQAARREHADFMTDCTAYKALLQSHNLPLTLDLEQVAKIYRGRLFEQLLAADTGLQARYALARTREAQQQVRQQTMATLDLTGHELLDQVSEAAHELEQAYHAVRLPNDVKRPDSLSQLASWWELDLGRLLDQYTMNWAGKEAAQAYFEQLGQVLTQWHALMSALGKNPNTLAQTLALLDFYFPGQVPSNGAIVVDEQKLYQQLQDNERLLELLPAIA